MIDGITPFVYLMRRSDGSWKIGFSADPIARARSLASQFPGIRFRIERLWKREDAYRIERISQRIMRPYMDLRTDGGETFRAPRKVILAAIEEAMFIADGAKAS